MYLKVSQYLKKFSKELLLNLTIYEKKTKKNGIKEQKLKFIKI